MCGDEFDDGDFGFGDDADFVGDTCFAEGTSENVKNSDFVTVFH